MAGQEAANTIYHDAAEGMDGLLRANFAVSYGNNLEAADAIVDAGLELFNLDVESDIQAKIHEAYLEHLEEVTHNYGGKALMDDDPEAQHDIGRIATAETETLRAQIGGALEGEEKKKKDDFYHFLMMKSLERQLAFLDWQIGEIDKKIKAQEERIERFEDKMKAKYGADWKQKMSDEERERYEEELETLDALRRERGRLVDERERVQDYKDEQERLHEQKTKAYDENIARNVIAEEQNRVEKAENKVDSIQVEQTLSQDERIAEIMEALINPETPVEELDALSEELALIQATEAPQDAAPEKEAESNDSLLAKFTPAASGQNIGSETIPTAEPPAQQPSVAAPSLA